MTMMRRSSAAITMRQLEILAVVAQQEHWFIGEIASKLGISSAAATKAIARLERKGLVTRSIDRMDRRCVKVSLTRAGLEAVCQMAQTV
jgi:DNA-binding MarR family transcriptional regulator